MIDANIFNSQVQQPQNPLAQLAQGLALKNAVQQQQTGNIEIQQKKQELLDQKAMTAAMQEWDGKDFNALPGLMLKRGASAKAVMSTKSGILEQQQKLATLGKDQLANEAAKNDRFAQSIANLRSLPFEQQGQAFEDAKADAVRSGYMDPQHAQQLVYQGPSQLDLLEKSLIGHKASLEAADKQATIASIQANTANAKADLPGKQADAAQKQRMDAANRLVMAQNPQEYQALWGQLPAGIALSFPRPDQWTPKSRTAILQAGMTPEQVTSTTNTVRGQDLANARSKEANNLGEFRTMSGAEVQLAGLPKGTVAQTNGKGKIDILSRPGDKPPTEGERVAFSFYKRATDAEKVLSELEPKIASMGLMGQTGRAVLPNVMQSDDNQVYQQAQRQFTQAKLRRESGAAISQSEFDNDAKTYFPQPGDSKAVLQRKAAARTAIIGELKTASGRAYADTYGDNTPTSDHHVINVSGKKYQYNGTGDTADMNNYTEIK